MSKAIDVSDLPLPLINAIEALVKTYRDSAGSGAGSPTKTPPIGWLRGKWELPESFFDPLPDNLVHLFNGGEEIA